MRIFNIVAVVIYTIFFCVIGSILIAFSLRTNAIDSVIGMLRYLSQTENIRLGMFVTGLLLIIVNISIVQLFLNKLQKQKTIAFENPYGQVTISLAAIEDYIKKLTQTIEEIKEIKSTISASKAGILINTRATLYADVNIPEVTEKIQNAIRLRLQEMLGIEEKVTIKVHVTKIVQREEKKTKQKLNLEEPAPAGFGGQIKYGK